MEESDAPRHVSTRTVVVVVYLSLFLDNMLLTVVAPIVPDYLRTLETRNWTDEATFRLLNRTHRRLEERIRERVPSRFRGYRLFLVRLGISGRRHAPGSDDPDGPDGPDGLWIGILEYITESYGRSAEEYARVGTLFSSKAFVQLLFNPLVGWWAGRRGYSLPLTVVYIFGRSYAVLFVARSVQGVASACISVSGPTVDATTLARVRRSFGDATSLCRCRAGMGLIADRFGGEEETRSRVMGFVMGGIALGVLVGYPLGGILYVFVGMAAPFVLVALLVLLDGGEGREGGREEGRRKGGGLTGVLSVRSSAGGVASSVGEARGEEGVGRRGQVGTGLHVLLKDSCILMAAGSICCSTCAMAVLEPLLPLWLEDTIRPEVPHSFDRR
ncbi:unnamed protein product [Darwinula stevensoni]|uniref:Major facilitator superfamily (MFS) profile domain-containing protein n=1 Tax=Darwinula stevensoni TaxID=69355 RepID=A0A7R8X786_9CRUS|nr:unnamed protein product [Darwinula stevensoni]CAG0882288.1 unnamed protein product [Darwinula stevensoni]